MSLKIEIQTKRLKRGPLQCERVYLKCTNGLQKWREVLPFTLERNRGMSEYNNLLMAKAAEVAKSRRAEYESLESFAVMAKQAAT